jgi:hypothetical protein
MRSLISKLEEVSDDELSANLENSDLEALEALVDKFTQGAPLDQLGVDDLDNESSYDTEQDDVPPSSQSSGQSFYYQAPRGLEHHINLRAGRSSLHRPRANYFPPVPEVEEQEQKERSSRTEEANFRKAKLKVRDLAVSEDCALWVNLTVDDLHEGQLTPESVSNFLHDLSRQHKQQTGHHLHYVAVIGTHGRGPHLHGLFSRDLDPEIVKETWPYGSVNHIVEIPEDDIEETVSYMAGNIRNNRFTHGRFLRSRGSKSEKIVVPVESVYEARDGLADMISPDKPQLRSARPFGDNPHFSFRFKPQRNQGDG